MIASSSSPTRWTRRSIAEAIIAGQLLFVYDQRVFRISKRWLSEHPGGEQVMLNYVGREATDVLNVVHDKKTVKRLNGFCVGELAEDEKESYVSLTAPALLGFVSSVDKDTGKHTWVQEGRIRRFELGRAERGYIEENDVPTLRVADLYPDEKIAPGELQASQDFKELTALVESHGFMEPGRWLSGYHCEVIRYLVLATAALWLWRATIASPVGLSRSLHLVGSAASLGLFWHLITFVAHDVGHRSLAHGSYFWNNCLGVVIADWLGGLSIGWWIHEHNIHHTMTNELEHDNDVQMLPFLAFNPESLDNLWSTLDKEYKVLTAFSRMMVGVQHLSYYILLSVGRFNLTILSLKHLALVARRDSIWVGELSGLAFFCCWFGGVLVRGLANWKERVAYILISYMVSSPLHLQIVLSHFARDMSDVGVAESHLRHQLRTAMDIWLHPALLFYYGGLENQVIHHLWPRMPRHNLRGASFVVREWCQQKGYQYDTLGFLEGNQTLLSILANVADQAALMGQVSKDLVDEMKRDGLAHAFTP